MQKNSLSFLANLLNIKFNGNQTEGSRYNKDGDFVSQYKYKCYIIVDVECHLGVMAY